MGCHGATLALWLLECQVQQKTSVDVSFRAGVI
jgi:hypothetical protein